MINYSRTRRAALTYCGLPLIVFLMMMAIGMIYSASSASANKWLLPKTSGVSAIASFVDARSPGLLAVQNNQVVLFLFNGKKGVLTGPRGPHAVSTPGFQDGAAGLAQFNHARGLVVDKRGNIYVADTLNSVIRYLDLQTMQVTTVAGTPGEAGYKDGPAGEAVFNDPSAIALDSHNNLVILDTKNSRVRYLDLKTHRVSTIAGPTEPKSNSGFKDGSASEAKFKLPRGLAIDDKTGAIYIADTDNHVIRRLDRKTDEVATVAGDSVSTYPGYTDGPALSATFSYPESLAFDPDGKLLIAESGNGTLRNLDLSSGFVDSLLPRGRGTTGLSLLSIWPTGAIFKGDTDGLCLTISQNDALEKDLLHLVERSTALVDEKELRPIKNDLFTRKATANRSANEATVFDELAQLPNRANVNYLGRLPNELKQKLQAINAVNSIDGLRIQLALKKAEQEGMREMANFIEPCGVRDQWNYRIRRIEINPRDFKPYVVAQALLQPIFEPIPPMFSLISPPAKDQ